MIEKYFTEQDIKLESVRDNGTSLTFTFSCPGWTKEKQLTISDLGIAKIRCLDPKDFTREDFVSELARQFMLKSNVYPFPDWEFPIPLEWKQSATLHVKSLMESKAFPYIGPSYFLDMDLPLFALCLLQEIKYTYDTGKVGTATMPDDLQNLLNNPNLLFEERYDLEAYNEN